MASDAIDEAGSARFDVVHASLLLHFADLVQKLGGDPDVLAARIGAGSVWRLQNVDEVSYRQAIALLELASVELDCPDFGLRLAEMQGGLPSFGPLGAVMRHARTFGEGLTYVSTHNAAHSLSARVWIKPLPAEKAIFVGHDILLDGLTSRGQSIEQILMIGHLAAIEMTGGSVRVRRVHFRHQPAMPPAYYRRRFGCEVLFGQKADGVFFLESDFDCPIVDPDADIYRAAVAYIESVYGGERPPVHTQVRGLVMQHLGSRHCTNEKIAAELAMQKRVLHRRLAVENTSFQKIKDEVRRDLMLYYLSRTDIDFARISEKLGFAEQSVMTRSCHRWLAASPTSIRRSARAKGAQAKSSSMPS